MRRGAPGCKDLPANMVIPALRPSSRGADRRHVLHGDLGNRIRHFLQELASDNCVGTVSEGLPRDVCPRRRRLHKRQHVSVLDAQLTIRPDELEARSVIRTPSLGNASPAPPPKTDPENGRTGQGHIGEHIEGRIGGHIGGHIGMVWLTSVMP